MAVIRIEKNKNYTVMSNVHLDDSRLSLRAIGLLSRMLRQPDDWDYSVRGLAAMCKEGRDAVANTLEELIEAGYVSRQRTRRDNGSFGGIEYVVHEYPRTEKADVDADDTPRPENPDTVNPDTENPNTENPPQPNTIYNQDTIVSNIITPYSPPKGGRRRRKKDGPRESPDWKPERFEGFWQFYPAEGRKDKQMAMDEWDKLRPSDELIAAIGLALRTQKKSEEWQRGIGIPYAGRYLRKERWKDAVAYDPAQPVVFANDTPIFDEGEGFWMGGDG